MKPKNFPGRKNKRLHSAAKLLSQQLPEKTEESDIKRIKKELVILDKKITTEEAARSSRSKKYRFAGGLRRN